MPSESRQQHHALTTTTNSSTYDYQKHTMAATRNTQPSESPSSDSKLTHSESLTLSNSLSPSARKRRARSEDLKLQCFKRPIMDHHCHHSQSQIDRSSTNEKNEYLSYSCKYPSYDIPNSNSPCSNISTRARGCEHAQTSSNRRRAFSQNEVQRFIVRRKRAESIDSISSSTSSISSLEDGKNNENCNSNKINKNNREGDCIRLLVRQNSPTRDIPIGSIRSRSRANSMYSIRSSTSSASAIATPEIINNIHQLPPEVIPYLQSVPSLTNRRGRSYESSTHSPEHSMYITNTPSKRRMRHGGRFKKYKNLIASMSLFYILLFSSVSLTQHKKNNRTHRLRPRPEPTLEKHNMHTQNNHEVTNDANVEDDLLLQKENNQTKQGLISKRNEHNQNTGDDDSAAAAVLGNNQKTLRRPKLAQANTLVRRMPQPKNKKTILIEKDIQPPTHNVHLEQRHQDQVGRWWRSWWYCPLPVVFVWVVLLKNRRR